MINGSVVGEDAGLDDDAYAKHVVEFLVFEESFAIPVVLLGEQILVLAFEETIVQFDNGIVVERPPAPLHQNDSRAKTPVCGKELRTHLIYARIVENVAVFPAIDYGNPEFAVDHEVGVDHNTSSEGNFVPRAGLYAVASVAFMLGKKAELAYETVFHEKRFHQPYAGVEVHVGHGQRFLKHVPEHLLCIEQKQVCSPGQCAFGQSLGYGYLELHI